MEDLVDRITRGNVTEVKVVLASVVTALALYQVALIAVAYGKLPLGFLSPGNASFTHRATGDAVVVVAAVVAVMCLAEYGFELGESGLHVIAGTLLFAVIAFKIAVLKWFTGLSPLLPPLGLTVLTLFLITWFTSAGDFLGVT